MGGQKVRKMLGLRLAAVSVLVLSVLGMQCARAEEPADSLAAGHAALAAHDVVAAKTAFQNAVNAAPSNPEANFMLGATRLAALLYLPETQTMLDRFGVTSEGRDPYNWTADLQYDASDKPRFPDSTPRGTEIQRFLVDSILPETTAALQNFLAVPGTFELFLQPAETGGTGTPTEFDYADALLARASLRGVVSAIVFVNAYNMDIDLHYALNKAVGGCSGGACGLVQVILMLSPDFMKIKDPGSAPLAPLAQMVPQGISEMLQAIDSISSETDDQSDDFITLPADTHQTEHLVNLATLFRNAFSTRSYFLQRDINGGSSTSDYPVFSLDLHAAVASRLELRDKLAAFDFCQMPDPTRITDFTFQGVFEPFPSFGAWVMGIFGKPGIPGAADGDKWVHGLADIAGLVGKLRVRSAVHVHHHGAPRRRVLPRD